MLWTKHFKQKPEGQCLGTNLLLEILPIATKIGIHQRLFYENNLIYKKFQEFAPGGVIF